VTEERQKATTSMRTPWSRLEAKTGQKLRWYFQSPRMICMTGMRVAPLLLIRPPPFQRGDPAGSCPASQPEWLLFYVLDRNYPASFLLGQPFSSTKADLVERTRCQGAAEKLLPGIRRLLRQGHEGVGPFGGGCDPIWFFERLQPGDGNCSTVDGLSNRANLYEVGRAMVGKPGGNHSMAAGNPPPFPGETAERFLRAQSTSRTGKVVWEIFRKSPPEGGWFGGGRALHRRGWPWFFLVRRTAAHLRRSTGPDRESRCGTFPHKPVLALPSPMT